MGPTDEAVFLIDKTMFIKEVIDSKNKTLLITAPNGFGKTTNLKILQSFLENKFYKKEEQKTIIDSCKIPTTAKKDYYSFINNSYDITECKNIMADYFGKYPVISLRFECFSVISSVDDAVKFYKRVVHSSYKDHEYLTSSDRLSFNERKLVRFWSDDHLYHKMSRRQVVTGVRELTRLVSRHWDDARAWVLVDDYDAVVRAAMVEVVDARDLRRVFRFTSRLIVNVFKNNSECVCGGVVTGVLPLSLFNQTDGLQCQMCTFLGDHRLVDFYGLADRDVERLFTRSPSRLNSASILEAEVRYGGYKSRGGKIIYNLRAVLNFEETGNPFSNGRKVSRMSNLSTFMKISQIRETMGKLLKGEIIPFYLTEAFFEEDLLDIHSILLKPESKISTRVYNLLLSHLLHEGFITYYTSSNQITNSFENLSYVKIPNKETAEEINFQFKLTP